MKIHKVQQGTVDWIYLRLGKITASDIHRVITTKTLKASASQKDYLCELAGEIILGHPLDDSTGKWMNRGSGLEEEARSAFSITTLIDVKTVGFIESDDGKMGCSPDGITEENAGVELKCPSAKKHISYLLDDDLLEETYRLQVQFGLWLTGWDYWWLVSYCPSFRILCKKIKPDSKVFVAFNNYITPFLLEVEEAIKKIKEIS